MTAFDRYQDDPVKSATLALHAGLPVADVGRIYGPAAHRACRIAALRRVLAEHDHEAADRAIGQLLGALGREAAA